VIPRAAARSPTITDPPGRIDASSEQRNEKKQPGAVAPGCFFVVAIKRRGQRRAADRVRRAAARHVVLHRAARRSVHAGQILVGRYRIDHRPILVRLRLRWLLDRIGLAGLFGRRLRRCHGFFCHGLSTARVASQFHLRRHMHYCAAPTVSAITAPRAPSGLMWPIVVSRAVWCSISALISAPTRTAIDVSHNHIIRPMPAPSEP
jgi:hypothetical protein